jgi:hypothetical protein
MNRTTSNSAVDYQQLSRGTGSISAVGYQQLSRDHTATQPWALAASQPWLTVELPLQYVLHPVLNLSGRFLQSVFCSPSATSSCTSCARAAGATGKWLVFITEKDKDNPSKATEHRA